MNQIIFPPDSKICPTVSCPLVKPYNVSNPAYSYGVLTGNGLPPIDNVINMAFAISMVQEVRIMNDTTDFCRVDGEMLNWCGSNKDSSYSYCIVSEVWPQPDIIGWLENTTFHSNLMTYPGYPSLCVCHHPGRAYYIPAEPYARPKFHISCPKENVLLAAYIFIAVINAMLLLWVIWDLILLVTWTVQNKVDVFTSSFKVKIFVVLYCLVKIAYIGAYAGVYSSEILQELIAWMRLGCIILLLSAYSLSIFTFTELIIETQFIGDDDRFLKYMRVIKWIVFVFTAIVLATGVVLIGVDDHYTRALFSTDNFYQKSSIQKTLSLVVKSVMLMLVLLQAILGLQSGVILGGVTFVFASKSNIFGQKHMKNIFVRNVALILALFFLLINLAFVAYSCYWIAWSYLSTYNTEYETIIATYWIFFADDFSQFLWIWAVSYAMRTSVNRTWLYEQFKSKFRSASRGQESNSSNSVAMSEMNISSRQ